MWNSRTGTLRSLYLSAAAGALVAAYAITKQDWYVAIMFGLLAYGSFQSINFYQNHWR
jgi:hypothetical protein